MRLEAEFVIHEALDLAHRRQFANEVRGAHLNGALGGLEHGQHFHGELREAVCIEHHPATAHGLEQCNETRHMGAFLIGGQTHRKRKLAHTGLGLCVLTRDHHGVANTANPYAIDGQVAQIAASLYVGHGLRTNRLFRTQDGALQINGLVHCTSLSDEAARTAPEPVCARNSPARCRMVASIPLASRPSRASNLA